MQNLQNKLIQNLFILILSIFNLSFVQKANVCLELSLAIQNKLSSTTNWQMTLADKHNNILGYGASSYTTIDITLYEKESEFYLFFFTNEGPLNFGENVGFRANYFVDNNGDNIVITHRIKENGLKHLNACNIPLKQLFTNYTVNIHF